MGYFSWACMMFCIIAGGCMFLVGCTPTEDVRLTNVPKKSYPLKNIYILEQEKKQLLHESEILKKQTGIIKAQQQQELQFLH